MAATVIQGVHGRRRVGQGDAFWQYRPYRDGDSAGRSTGGRARAAGICSCARPNGRPRPACGCGATPRLDAITRRGPQHRHQGGARRALDPGAGQPLGRCRRARRRAGRRHAADGRPGRGAAHRRDAVRRRTRRSRTPPSLPPLVPLPAHGTIVLVSDWLDPLDKIEAVIRHYASGGVRGHLVQVLDPAEEDLPFDGRVQFRRHRGARRNHRRRVESVRDDYSERFRHHRDGARGYRRGARLDLRLGIAPDRRPRTRPAGLAGALWPTADGERMGLHRARNDSGRGTGAVRGSETHLGAPRHETRS